MKPKKLPSKETLDELLIYNKDTGELINRCNRGRRAKRGCAATSKCSNIHYLKVNITVDDIKKPYLAHRIIWMMMTGEDPGDKEVEHINGDGRDNRWDNLRLATRAQNNRNRRCRGYSYFRGKYVARIYCDGKQILIGRYDCPLLARLAYEDKSRELFGEYTAV